MTAAALVADLRRRGVRLEARGDRLRLAPASAVTPEERAALAAAKADVLALLTADQHRAADRQEPETATTSSLTAGSATVAVAGDPTDPLAATLAATVATPEREPCAWLLYSRRLDRQVWVAKTLAALLDLERDGLGGLPVILADDLERLRGLDDATLTAVLNVTATWPGARVGDCVPEPGEGTR